MRKNICDICGGDLMVIEHDKDSIIDRIKTKLFICKNPFYVYRIDLCLSNILFRRNLDSKMDFCGKCFDDFKEYVMRKNSNLVGKK